MEKDRFVVAKEALDAAAKEARAKREVAKEDLE